MSRHRIDVRELMKTMREGVSLEPRDWILLILYAAPKHVLPSEVHLQKAVFIASQYFDELRDVLEFKPYRMGAWSDELKDSLEVLEASEDVVKNDVGALKLTEKAVLQVKSLWESLPEEKRRILDNIASFICALSVDELLIYTYVVYGYEEKSDVFEKLLKKRFSLAISMLEKGVISVELAAKVAGLPLTAFVGELKRKGIKPYVAEVQDVECAGAMR